MTMPLGARISSVVDRHQFYSVRIENGQAIPAFKASGDITSMSQADGYIEVPIGVSSLEQNSIVEVNLF
jgi:molybdopterin biosynthesis enzyme